MQHLEHEARPGRDIGVRVVQRSSYAVHVLDVAADRQAPQRLDPHPRQLVAQEPSGSLARAGDAQRVATFRHISAGR